MKKAARYLLGGLVVLSLTGAFAPAAWAAATLDQVSPVTDLNLVIYPGLKWQQGVVAGMAGELVQVDLYAWSPGVGALYLYRGSPAQTGVPDFTAPFSATAEGWFSVDVSAGAISLNTGDPFTIGVEGTDFYSIFTMGGSHIPPSGGYLPGRLWNGSSPTVPEEDLGFRTYMDPGTPTVPAPGTLVLAALGASIVSHLRRRRSL